MQSKKPNPDTSGAGTPAGRVDTRVDAALAQQLRHQAAQLREFNRWKEEHPAPPREFSRVLADLSAIRRWIPEPDRLLDPDPEKLGVARLHAAIALLRHP